MASPTGTIHEVAVTPIHVKSTNASDFSADGLVAKPSGILTSLGYTNIPGILNKLPAIRHGGVQTAAVGMIQDPAGSAIGFQLLRPRELGITGAGKRARQVIVVPRSRAYNQAG